MTYKYTGIELTPEIFAKLLSELFAGEQTTRVDCIKKITTYHINNGGICKKKSYIQDFKSATLLLRNKGYNIDNPGYGVWRIGVDCKDYITFREELSAKKINNLSTDADKLTEIGNGNQKVYVYYFPIYRKFARIQGKNYWHCKIGMTTKDVFDRIYSQTGTCYPEKPFLALIINCDDALKLEKTVHNILTMNNKQIKDAPGKEWFLTSPEEIISIYNSIFQTKKEETA